MATPTQATLNLVQNAYIAYYGRPADPVGQLYWADRVQNEAGGLNALINEFGTSEEATLLYGSMPYAEAVNTLYQQMFGRDADSDGHSYYVLRLMSGASTLASIAMDIFNGTFAGTSAGHLADQSVLAAKLAAANAFTAELDTAVERVSYDQASEVLAGRDYLSPVINTATANTAIANADDFVASLVNGTDDTDGTSFTLTEDTAAGADVMRLTGDMDARIDVTVNDNQVKGLDLNGNGAIEFNGVENNNPTPLDDGKDFEIVDAYVRDRLNLSNLDQNFLGDLAFDGTGFGGDGVTTNGNIFLGGLGADLAFGGIGNDFMVGGGVFDTVRPTDTNENGTIEVGEVATFIDDLHGGRNADFFFAEFSTLDMAEGDSLFIDGGSTSDDAAVGNNTAQDSDWFLVEASDDEEPYTINLSSEDSQAVYSSAGHTGVTMWEIENIDASGNLYGFLDDVNVALGEGGLVIDGENVGIGSSAQLRIIGSVANNILIGGYDNDLIEGGEGSDLLLGGNLKYSLNNDNAAGIVNDGMDELFGGDGNDNIGFEADGGIVDGDNDDDTLWLTSNSLGTTAAADASTLISDGVLRFELENNDGGSDGNDTFAGTGGADVDGTADQTNYISSSKRVDVTNMENVIATGMGAIDYLAAGTNDPELVFNNQQNLLAYNGDLDIRGTDGANTLYAAAGDDTIEGREGNDKLSGGNGRDDFYFELTSNEGGDGVDVIHRQHDIGNNITDGTFEQDFGTGSNTDEGDSFLTVDFTGSDLALPGVAVTTFQVTVDGEVFSGGSAATLQAFTTVDALAAHLNSVFHALDDTLSVTAAGNLVVITKQGGGVFGTDIATGTIVAGAATNGPLQTEIEATNELDIVTPDRLIYKAYEDRSDNEGVDDDGVTGSAITLGQDSYAEDLVVDFAADGTRIAEDQAYAIQLNNVTTEDTVTVTVNGVEYSLQVGVSVDGTQVDDEDGVGDTQAQILDAFGNRFADFINSFMDDDTASGSVNAAWDNGTNTLTLTQNAYSDSEEVVFMTTPLVSITNQSGGERASYTVTNLSQHEVHLLDYAGTNNDSERLTQDNVLFIGQEGVDNSRAVLSTALIAGGVLNGSDAVVINGGVDDLINVTHNLATDDELQTDSDDDGSINDETNGNFIVHGDDYLIGGAGNDAINGGTGDDRIRGSLGTDTVDGGVDLYAVRVQGQTKYAIEELNSYAAEQRDLEAEVLDMYLLEQSEEADVVIEGDDFADYFQDTLVFEQADFTAGDTEFTINLNNFVDDAVGVSGVRLTNGGAGTVSVDVEGDGDFEGVTSFENFEHIRTISGVGHAVANDGQGNDTLVVTALSNATGGVFYSLENDLWTGQVWVDTGVVPDTYEQYLIAVDGVENVVAGNGDDALWIDETEAAKDNSFQAGLGDDWIVYTNNYGDADLEPTVTIVVEAEDNTDEVIMTMGRVGQTVATDTLVSVENLSLNQNTATGIREDDTLDVTNVTTDVVVNYITGEVSTGGEVLIDITNIQEIENVLTDANDLLIVADADVMSTNSRSDSWAERKELVIDTYLNYDSLDADLNRETVGDMRANNEFNNEIPEARNFEQFNFNLGAFTDRVDYSQTDDQIASLVAVDADTNYVLVNGTGGLDGYRGSEDRVDALVGVEEIVASTGQSVLDFTQLGQDVQISFQFDENNADGNLDRLESLIRIGDGNGNTIDGIPNYVEYYDLDDNDNVDAFANATWNRIEGSDFSEAIDFDGSEDLVNLAGVDHRYSDDEMNLRGGDNQVSYFKLETSITAVVSVTEFDEDNADTTGLIEATIDFQDGSGGPLANAGTHTITSYTGDNGIAAGTLKLEASQDAEDSVMFASVSEKVFFLGRSAGVMDVQIGDLDAMRLTGFEALVDADSDDVYDMEDLTTVLGGLDLVDNGADDEDTIAVNDDAVGYDAAPADTVSLEVLNDTFAFDFDILDITQVTDNNLILVGDTDVARDINNDGGDNDSVVVGDLDLIDDVQLFDAIIFTDASITSAGDTFVVDTDNGELEDGFGNVLFTFDAALDTLDFSRVSAATDITVTVTGATGMTIITDGEDTITGGAGVDTIVGGAFADVLDGNIVPEVQEVQTVVITGAFGADGSNDGTIEIGNITLTEAAAAVLGTSVVDGSSNLQIGNAFAAIAEADWEAALGLTAGDLNDVSFDNGTGVLSFTFASGVDAVDGSVLAASGGYTAGTDTGAIVLGAGTDVAYAAQGEAVDIFVYEIASDSTAAAMDEISNFSVGAVDDIIDLSAVAAAAPIFHAGVQNGGSAFADFAAVSAAADAYLQTHVNSVFVGSDGTDSWVFADANHSIDLDAGDVVIKLVGIDATGIDANNFAFV
jgi:hypothetical protein